MTLIKPYTPLWIGEVECGKRDCINIPVGADFRFYFQALLDETRLFTIATNIDGSLYAVNLNPLQTVHTLLWTPQNNLNVINLNTSSPASINVEGTCYTWTVYEAIDGAWVPTGTFWSICFWAQNACLESLVKVEWKTECDQPQPYTYYIDGAFVRTPLAQEDELRVILPNGRSKKIYSRNETQKEIRVRPLSLSTHELLEYVLNLNEYTVNGVSVSPAAGAVYTFADNGIGRYTGRIAVVTGAQVYRECCVDTCCDYVVEGIDLIPNCFRIRLPEVLTALDGFDTFYIYAQGSFSTTQFQPLVLAGNLINNIADVQGNTFVVQRQDFIDLAMANLDYSNQNSESDWQVTATQDGFIVCQNNLDAETFNPNLVFCFVQFNNQTDVLTVEGYNIVEYISGPDNKVTVEVSTLQQYTFQVLQNGVWTTKTVTNGTWSESTCDIITEWRIIDNESNVIQSGTVSCS